MSKTKQLSYEVSASYLTTLESGKTFYVTINRDKKGVRKLYIGASANVNALAGDFIIDNADEMDQISAFAKEAAQLFDEQFGTEVKTA